MIRVESHLSRKVERHRQPGLTLSQQVAKPSIGFLCTSEARVLSHRPEPLPVYLGVDAARVWKLTRPADHLRIFRGVAGVVDGVYLDAGIGCSFLVHSNMLVGLPWRLGFRIDGHG